MKFDIILKGATVLDPSQKINTICDVGIKQGKVAEIKPEISAELGEKSISLEGYTLVPGLIDMHCHVYPSFPVEKDGLPTVNGEAHMFQSGVTTCVDAGTCGIRDFVYFKERVIDKAKLRILSFINIANGGMVNLESEQNINEFKPEAVAAMINAFPECAVGVKTAHYWVGKPEDEKHPVWESIDRTLEAGELCNKPVMVDFQPNLPKRTYPELLKKLRPGDIHTHVYAQQFPILDDNGKVNDFLFEARERKINFDLGHGAGSFWFRNAIPALKQGFYPDTISTDLYQDNVVGPVNNLLNIMSKYLNMGMSVEDIVYHTTVRPAEIVGHPELGTLKVGSCADLAVLNVRETECGFADSGHASIKGNHKFECILTIRDGEVVYNPNGLGMPCWENAPKEYWTSPGVII